MSLASKLMTSDEFLIWRQGQEGTWEFVDGAPRRKFANPLNMMAGGTRNHARVAANLIVSLTARLRGGPCEPIGSDLAVRNKKGGVRQPDVVVDCGYGEGEDLTANEPRVIFEVLSPSTRRLDFVRKADEYRQLASLGHLVLLEADRPYAYLWTRDADDWAVQEVEGIEAELNLSAIDVVVPLAEVYARIDLKDYR